MKDEENSFVTFIKKNKGIIITMAVFAIIYSLISLVNHYNFRTYNYDLGIFNNAIYDYAHFRSNDCMLIQPQYTNWLSDHFSLTPFFFAPFYILFGTYTLLLFQIISILWGGLGIYKCILKLTGKSKIALLSLIHFYLMWGIYSALGFDFHTNVVGAMFVPWFFYYTFVEKWIYSVICFFLLITSKENMALWAVFICAGLIIQYRKDKKKLLPLTLLACLALFYFILIVGVVMPALSNAGRGYQHLKYQTLGGSVGKVLETIFVHPRHTFSLLFINHLKDPSYNEIKTELHFIVLLSGGFALLLNPRFLVMLIPVYAQKLFSDNMYMWGINAQYSIEFAPILTLALFHWISGIKTKLQFVIALLFTVLCSVATISTIDYRVSKYYSPVHLRFWDARHYKNVYNVEEVHKALKLIPSDVPVSAQTMVVPHLALRNTIYQFPTIYNSQYIILLPGEESTWPLNLRDYNNKIKKLKESSQWELITDNSFLLIFKRKN